MYVLGSKQATSIGSQVFQCDYLQPYFIEAVHLTKKVRRLSASMSTEEDDEDDEGDDSNNGVQEAAAAAVWKESVVGLSEHLDLHASVSAAMTASPFVVQPHIAGGASSTKDFIDALCEATAGFATDERQDNNITGFGSGEDECEGGVEDHNAEECGKDDAEFPNQRRLFL